MPSDGYHGMTVRMNTYKQAIDLAAFLTLQDGARVTVSQALSRAMEHYRTHLETTKPESVSDETEQP